MKKIIITRGVAKESCSRQYVEGKSHEELLTEYLNAGLIEFKDDEVLLETDDETKAKAFFRKQHSEIYIAKTPTGYEIEYIIVEMYCDEGYIDEDGDWNSEKITSTAYAQL